MDLLYFDNAATSWPKPEETQAAMSTYLREIGGSPGRSGHRLSLEAGRVILDARESVARLFGVDDPFRIVFTKNATEALNIALLGLLDAGDHVITSSMEHNSVMRPLRALEREGVAVSVIPCSVRGELDPTAIRPAIRPNTRAIVLTHASNVTGTDPPHRRGESGRPRARPRHDRRCGANSGRSADCCRSDGDRPHGIHGPQVTFRPPGNGRSLTFGKGLRRGSAPS